VPASLQVSSGCAGQRDGHLFRTVWVSTRWFRGAMRRQKLDRRSWGGNGVEKAVSDSPFGSAQGEPMSEGRSGRGSFGWVKPAVWEIPSCYCNGIRFQHAESRNPTRLQMKSRPGRMGDLMCVASHGFSPEGGNWAVTHSS
jgi:hypothetical protein